MKLVNANKNPYLPVITKMLDDLKWKKKKTGHTYDNNGKRHTLSRANISEGNQTEIEAFVLGKVKAYHSYHFDKGNIGESLCIGLGNFKSGGGIEIIVGEKHYKIDNKNKWLVYSGNKYEHKTLPHSGGTRYAVIFFQKRR